MASTTAKRVTAEPFQQILSDVKTRLFRFKLNATNRNLVFRPRRAKELESRRHPIMFDGQALRPLNYEGLPGRGALFGLINQMTENGSAERYEQTKSALQDYCTYVPGNVSNRHLSLFVRNAAQMGKLADSLKFLNHPVFADLVRSRTFNKEVLRLRSCAASANRAINTGVIAPIDYANSVMKAYKRAVAQDKTPRMSASSTLASLYGLASCAMTAQKSSIAADASDAQKASLSTIKELLQSQIDLANQQIPKMQRVLDKKTYINYNKLAMLVDVRLGIMGLKLASQIEGVTVPKDIDISSLRTLAKSCKSTLSRSAFDDYFAAINESYPTELENRRSHIQPAKTEPESS